MNNLKVESGLEINQNFYSESTSSIIHPILLGSFNPID